MSREPNIELIGCSERETAVELPFAAGGLGEGRAMQGEPVEGSCARGRIHRNTQGLSRMTNSGHG